MTESQKSSETPLFKAGEIHPFTVWKVITQFDETRSWVLMDQQGQRYLLPFDSFVHYGFKEKEIITCRIDKINCNGKIFIEPVNPYYTEGAQYSFPVIGKDLRINAVGEKVHGWLLKDVFDNEIFVEVAPQFFDLQGIPEIICTVARIKNGRLILRHAYEPELSEILKVDKVYSLLVLETDHFYEGVKYFLLQDDRGNKHLMKAARFTDRGFQAGDLLQCKVVRVRSEGRFVFEVIQ